MQLVIISGKGGTGKTTVASAFASLAPKTWIKVDCDVDASNLHLMFPGQDQNIKAFQGAKVAHINKDMCGGCQACLDQCRFQAIDLDHAKALVNPLRCEGCGACVLVCQDKAIRLEDEVTGHTLMTQSSQGLISRARMYPGAEGSGKLVSQVRKNALAQKDVQTNHYIIDGSPGVGCGVMASVTGCDYGLIVTEASQSAYEDLQRVHALLKHFSIKAFVMINKYDIDKDMTHAIEDYCKHEALQVLGRVPFDGMVLKAINQGKPIVTYKDSPAGQALIGLWDTLNQAIGG